MNNQGKVAFNAWFGQPSSGSLGDSGIWQEAAGSGELTLVVKSGQTLHSNGEDMTYAGGGLYGFNDFGQVLFSALPTLSDPNLAYRQRSLWVADPASGLQLIVASNQEAPGTTLASGQTGVFETTNSYPVINDNGQIAFRASINGLPVPRGVEVGVWRDSVGGQLEPVATPIASPIPSDWSLLVHGVNHLQINNENHIAFSGATQGYRDSIWSDVGGNGIEPLFLSGDIAPDTDTRFSFFYGLSLNDRGQLAFLAAEDPPLKGFQRHRGIWRTNLNGQAE